MHGRWRSEGPGSRRCRGNVADGWRRSLAIVAAIPLIALALSPAGAVPTTAAANAVPAPSYAAAPADRFKALFLDWRRLDDPERGVIAIPSIHPVGEPALVFSSYFGIRSDPFTGRPSMHTGVDIPGAIGTPIYATAAGIVDVAGVTGGYGNLVEIDHGHGIATRYGHLSKILVAPNQRVARGQEIGLMGSTGRSTGSHLHYEVRIAGRAVDPMPFLQSADFLQTLRTTPSPLQTAALTKVPDTDD